MLISKDGKEEERQKMRKGEMPVGFIFMFERPSKDIKEVVAHMIW